MCRRILALGHIGECILDILMKRNISSFLRLFYIILSSLFDSPENLFTNESFHRLLTLLETCILYS